MIMHTNNTRAMLRHYPRLGELAWVPIPVFMVCIVVLWALDLRSIHESVACVMVLNLVFSTLASLLVSILIARSFLIRRTPGLLLLGCGVLLWGCAGTLAPVLLMRGVNFSSSVHNPIVCIAALILFTGAMISPLPWRITRQPWSTLALAYSIALCIVWLVLDLAVEGRMPLFFVPGKGGTPMRNAIFAATIVMFTFSAAHLWIANRPKPSPFVRWFSLALLLLATAMSGSLFITSTGTMLNWICRFAQYTGGAYMVIAAIASMRESGELEISLEKALSQSEERYRALFNSMSEGFAILEMISDDQGKPVDFRYLDFNLAFEHLTDFSRNEVIGKTFNEVLADDDPKWINIFGTIARTGEPIHIENYSRQLKRHYEVMAYRSAPQQVAVIFMDITQRKRMEQQLQEINESLEKRVEERTAETRRLADQLRALASELGQTEQRERKRLATILHDHIQQLLVAALLQLSLIRREDPQNTHAVTLGTESIINEALDALRTMTVELSPPILHQAGLTAGLTWLANNMEKKHLFKVHLHTDNQPEPTDENIKILLFESVRELLLNAVKHSGVKEADVTMSLTEDGRTQIVMEDHGRGFDPATIHERQDNGGFGLFNIEQRLAHLGGQLRVNSSPGAGSRIVLLTPPQNITPSNNENQERSAPDAKSDSQSHQAVENQISVLLVDDHTIMRQGIVSILQCEEDIKVVAEAQDGQTAIELARQHKPDVIIMDINMPGINGVEATRIIMREMPQSKIIGLSMHNDTDIAASMLHAGALGFLTKGGPAEDLTAAIRICSCGGHLNTLTPA